MVRTQIQLTEDQAARLKAIAHAGGESIAAVIRRALDQYLQKQEPDRKLLYRQALTVAGKYTAGVHNISLEHDLPFHSEKDRALLRHSPSDRSASFGV